ncbi:phosphotransferase [Fundidesulfovibrio putealis]|uniref:phosphotransferase n=1 Tax=Fundidesulfovibrio putealis TaxID=270496 RepID=UPI00041A6C65|nr:phosphotransferase [Fundidesulfovibrio putealis]
MVSADRAESNLLMALTRLGLSGASVAAAGNGGNSRVFLLSLAGGERLAAKVYPAPTAEGRSRLDVEFSALGFLEARGETAVPRPVARDDEAQVGIYEYVLGEPVHQPGEAHLDEMLAFLERLRGYSRLEGAACLPPASASVLRETGEAWEDCPDACPGWGPLSRGTALRFQALLEVEAERSDHGDMLRFVRAELVPALKAFAQGEPVAGPWTLSPSDLGFHNALVRTDGSVCFLDFEYFGRDDPAKMLCDVLLHPGNRMRPAQRTDFVKRTVRLYAQGDPGLAGRLAALYPVAALAWCAIMLNPFLPGHHADPGIAAVRLDAARNMLALARQGISEGDFE